MGFPKMRIVVADYDRTLTDESLKVPQYVVDAIVEAKQRLKLSFILVTGRVSTFLSQLGNLLDAVDAVVLENGAVIYIASEKRKLLLEEAVANEIRKYLLDADFPVEFGDVIAATSRLYEGQIIGRLKPIWHKVDLIYNRDDLMILPKGLDKARGVREAIKLLSLHESGIICFGDAENDIPLLRMANLAVAVENAIDWVKREADVVCQGYGGIGVAAFLKRLLDNYSDQTRDCR